MDNTELTRRNFTVLLVGDCGVGKTSYINRQRTGEFGRNYIATTGYIENVFDFETTIGKISLNIVDTAGQDKFTDNTETIYDHADAAIVMLDVTSRQTRRNVSHWTRILRDNNSNLPIILVCNKLDVHNIKVSRSSCMRCCHDLRLRAYKEISVKSCYGICEPEIHLLRLLTNNFNIEVM